MPSFFVLSPSGKLRWRIARHKGVVVRRVEKQTIALRGLKSPNPFKYPFGYLHKVVISHPVPLLPVSLTCEFSNINGANLLHRRPFIPLRKSVLTGRLAHPVPDAIQEILSHGRPLLTIASGDHFVDNAHDIRISINLPSQPQGAILFHLEFYCAIPQPCRKTGDTLRGSDIDLGDHLGFTCHPGDLTNIEVGSSLLRLNMEVCHVDILSGRVLHVKNII